MGVSALYQEIVLAHNRAPRNFGALDGWTHAADGANPLCGDALRCEARVRDGRVQALRFSGESCAITTATASMLGELVEGRAVPAVEELQRSFAAMLAGGDGADGLGELVAMRELRQFPARIKCAMLPFATLLAALHGESRATTESGPSDAAGRGDEPGRMYAPVSFRAAAESDVPAIVALVESAYRGDASRAGWTTEADFLDGQRTDPLSVSVIIAKPEARIVLAESGGELVACAHVERQGEASYFGMFSVRPTAQGNGIGDALLGESERVARDELGCSAMRMNVISIRAELIAWYERRGYSPTGETSPFPYGDERFGIPKRDDLVFLVLTKPLASNAARASA